MTDFDCNIVTDKELILRLRNDDEEAFKLIYDRYWAPMFTNAFRRVQDKALSQDIVQEVFLDIWRRRHKLDLTNLAGYLHTAVRFMSYRNLSKMPVDSVYYKNFEHILVSGFFAEDLVQEKELEELLNNWILALPKKRRQIFILHFQEHLSTKSIATRLGVSQKTVQNQLNTAFKEIRRKYVDLFVWLLIISEWIDKQ